MQYQKAFLSAINSREFCLNFLEFFLCKRRELKDGTESWDIGVSPASQPNKGLVLENIHGTKKDAEARLTEILKEAAAKDREISWNDNAPHAE